MIKVIKEDNKYMLCDGSILLSSVEFKKYKNLSFVHLYNLKTNNIVRSRGYASLLISYVCNEFKNGVYAFVEKNNLIAIKLYKRLNFEFIKEYRIKDKYYYIVAKGNKNFDELKNNEYV